MHKRCYGQLAASLREASPPASAPVAGMGRRLLPPAHALARERRL